MAITCIFNSYPLSRRLAAAAAHWISLSRARILPRLGSKQSSEHGESKGRNLTCIWNGGIQADQSHFLGSSKLFLDLWLAFPHPRHSLEPHQGWNNDADVTWINFRGILPLSSLSASSTISNSSSRQTDARFDGRGVVWGHIYSLEVREPWVRARLFCPRTRKGVEDVANGLGPPVNVLSAWSLSL